MHLALPKIDKYTGVTEKSKLCYYCNNFVYCQLAFIIFGKYTLVGNDLVHNCQIGGYKKSRHTERNLVGCHERVIRGGRGKEGSVITQTVLDGLTIYPTVANFPRYIAL